MTNEEIARLVREHLSAAKSRWQEQLGEINFTVEAANIRNGDNWWRVMVRPSQEPWHLFALYELLAEVSEALHEETGRNILLTGGEPLAIACPMLRAKS